MSPNDDLPAELRAPLGRFFVPPCDEEEELHDRVGDWLGRLKLAARAGRFTESRRAQVIASAVFSALHDIGPHTEERRRLLVQATARFVAEAPPGDEEDKRIPDLERIERLLNAVARELETSDLEVAVGPPMAGAATPLDERTTPARRGIFARVMGWIRNRG